MKKSVRLSNPWLWYIVRLVDFLAIWTAGFSAIYLRRLIEINIVLPVDLSGYYGLITIAAFLFSGMPTKVYQSWRGSQIPSMLAEVALRWFAIVGLILLWVFLFKAADEFSRIWFVIWILLGLICLWLDRFLIYGVLHSLRKHGFNLRHVALVGSGLAADRLKERVTHSGWSGYAIRMSISDINEANLQLLAGEELDEIWLALPLRDEAGIQATLHALRHSTSAIRFVPDLFTLKMINHGVTEVVGVPMYDLSSSPMAGWNQFLKWLEDKTLSGVILLVISPLMLLLAAGVKFSSPGPVFYRQERVGLNGKPFQMLKFRSMPVDVEKGGIQWGGSAAKTTTSFGQWIRKTSLDELPQFLNVLKGDMSIVGPRPERPIFVEQFKEEIPDYMKKHLVKAGITGWAQVHGWRGDTDLNTRIEYDIYYIEHWSIWLDLRIVFLTIFKGFVHKNAY